MGGCWEEMQLRVLELSACPHPPEHQEPPGIEEGLDVEFSHQWPGTPSIMPM